MPVKAIEGGDIKPRIKAYLLATAASAVMVGVQLLVEHYTAFSKEAFLLLYPITFFTAAWFVSRNHTAERERESNTERLKLREALHSRDEFLSIASHELKTPITSLKLQMQMMKRVVKPEQNIVPSAERLARALDMSLAQLNRLVVLMDDLLDVAKIGSGKLSYRFQTTVLEGVVNDVAERFDAQAVLSGCLINVQVAKNIKGHWDRVRLEQVITNLLSNAIKYAAGRPINIYGYLEGDDAFIKVQDFGPGVSSDKKTIIFERFERGSNAPGVGGLGLGLYIAKEIVTAHGGDIRVESEAGKGSTFVVKLPTAPRDVTARVG